MSCFTSEEEPQPSPTVPFPPAFKLELHSLPPLCQTWIRANGKRT